MSSSTRDNNEFTIQHIGSCDVDIGEIYFRLLQCSSVYFPIHIEIGSYISNQKRMAGGIKRKSRKTRRKKITKQTHKKGIARKNVKSQKRKRFKGGAGVGAGNPFF